MNGAQTKGIAAQNSTHVGILSLSEYFK